MYAVPLEAGGGTRLKILEAFAAGLPVVSTAIGAEGIEAEDGIHFLRAERPQFAASIIRILRDRVLGRTLASAARRLALEKYDWNAIAERTASVYTKYAKPGK